MSGVSKCDKNSGGGRRFKVDDVTKTALGTLCDQFFGRRYL